MRARWSREIFNYRRLHVIVIDASAIRETGLIKGTRLLR